MKAHVSCSSVQVWLSTCVSIAALLALHPAPVVAGDTSPFADAAAVWHMDGVKFAGGLNDTLRAHDGAQLGVELQGAERDASLRRGGDGKIAVLDEGFLNVSLRQRSILMRVAQCFSLCMRVRDPQGQWDAPLLAQFGSAWEFPGLLYGTQTNRGQIGFREMLRIQEGASLEFLLHTTSKGRAKSEWNTTADFQEGVLRIGVPVELIGPADWHDVIVRYTGPRVEMFVDGVLVDEEWPHGESHLPGWNMIGAAEDFDGIQPGLRCQVDHFALWDRALTDAEIATLSGGPQEVARRELEILGPEDPDGQYWRPRGHNAFVGDVMLFFHDGRLHVFYLFDRRHHGSKWGTGAHQFAHRSTRDLVHWEDHPMALPITDPTECSLGTGCCVLRDGTYYLYYIQHGRRLALADAPYPGDNIFVATSQDGIHFTKDPKPVVLMNYRNGGDINPHVFATEIGDRFLMTISGWKIFSSANLLDWTEVDLPQLSSIKWICTTNFQWNGWRYFTGCGNYVMSTQPIEETKEWIRPPSQALRDAVGVPVVCEFTGNRRIYAGFAAGSYAQELVFRELVQEQDGELGMQWPEEMIPRTGDAVPCSCTSVKGDVAVGDHSVRLTAQDDFACAMLTGLAQNVRITLRAIPGPGVLNFGLCCRGQGEYQTGCELRFEPAGKRIQYCRAVPGQPGKDARDGSGLDQVTGLDQEFTIDMVVKDDLVDVCVGGRRTLLNRNSADGDRLFFFVRNGSVSFDGIQVRPLLSQPVRSDTVALGELLFQNSDFERGDLTSWTAQGDAFDHMQPTKGGASSSQIARNAPGRDQRR